MSDLILEYCTLSSLCLPEQWIQMRIPMLTLSQSGSGALQSAHLSLPGRLRILTMMRCTSHNKRNITLILCMHVQHCTCNMLLKIMRLPSKSTCTQMEEPSRTPPEIACWTRLLSHTCRWFQLCKKLLKQKKMRTSP